MSRINVDIVALTDGRFLRLGMLLGCPREFALDYGRGRMEHVWSYCLNQSRGTIDAWEVDAILGDGATAHVVAARLAEETPDGVRIRGTEGRIEWLEAKRGAAKRARTARLVSEPTKSLVSRDTHLSISQEQEQEQEDLSSGSGSEPQLVLVPEAPAVDVDALHAAAFAGYPASRRVGKSKGLEALRRSVATPADAERFLRVVSAHVASASEEKYLRQWERLCRTWSELPEVAPARASPDARRGSIRPSNNPEDYAVGEVEF